MEFRETLLAAQRNQQHKSSESSYYKAKFDPPKKEQKQRDKLSANIQKFLAKKDEEERQKKLDAERKRSELLAMRDPKAMRKIQKSLKVFKSANKSVLADAVDRDNTAITREGTEMPDQDDYGYESQEAAALYQKMMQKYSKIPDEPKFPVGNSGVKKDLNGTRERVKHALQHEDDPVPNKRRRRRDNSTERDTSPMSKDEPEKKKEEQSKPKIRKPMPPPIDFNQLLKLAEQKKSEPVEVGIKKTPTAESEPERLMTKRQKREYEEEMARRQRRQERIDAQKSGGRKPPKEEKPVERERKPEPAGFGRIPKIGDRGSTSQNNNSPKASDKERNNKIAYEKERIEKLQRERDRARSEKEKAEREKERSDKERLDKLKAERERIERDIERLNKDRERLEKTKSKLEANKSSTKPVDRTIDKSKIPPRDQSKKSIDLKSQNTYRIDKDSNGKRLEGGHGKPVPKQSQNQRPPQSNNMKDKVMLNKSTNGSPKLNGNVRSDDGKRFPEKSGFKKPAPNGKILPSSSGKSSVSNSFDFDKHVGSLGKNSARQYPPGHVKRKQEDNKKSQKRRVVNSDSEYDSEMDDFIDDGDENLDYSTHIKEIFGYDKSKYRNMDDDDDPSMESSFVRQQREEYISKKIGIMEDLEDMRMEAMEKKKSKKPRRISDDD